MRVALFATCLADRLYAEACADTVRLLRHVGATVEVPPGQTCCGQPALNAGHVREARRMAARTLEVLYGADYVVLPSGSCAAMIRHHLPGLLDGAERARAERLAARTWELSQFLVRVAGAERLGDGLRGRRVAYHHGCHALRQLGVHDEPVALLRAAGADVVPWEADRECCGFGGLFSVELPVVSAGMADRKLDTLPHVDCVVSADAGCLAQLSGRAGRRGPPLSFRHLASVLWEGVRGADASSHGVAS
ncbi:MAG TPA: (Fe-S)-binding protein [Longimicrobiales bacterium]|nr:(Fe-S)-binding protein [Longimicrobiales bacterium]